jgi:hypothetical protein
MIFIVTSVILKSEIFSKDVYHRFNSNSIDEVVVKLKRKYPDLINYYYHIQRNKVK